jgi:hypothetical protein
MRRLAAFLTLVMVAAVAQSQTVYESTMDLSDDIADSISIPVNSKLLIHVVNLAPGNDYDFSYEQYTTDPEPINTAGSFKQAANQPQQPLGVNFIAAGRSLENERDETRVPGLVDALRIRLSGLDPTVAVQKAEIDTINALISKTRRDFALDVTLAAKQGIIFTVRRSAQPNSPRVWRRDFHVGGRGNFVSNYVFGFAPNGDERYFSSPDAGKFKITEEVRRNKIGSVPLVLFSWIPTSKGNEPHVHSVAAGLGYDLSNLVVATGYIYTYNRNLGFTVGLLAQQQRRLKGKYHTNQVIDTNLESNDLTELTWRPNAYLGVSIRSVTALFR